VRQATTEQPNRLGPRGNSEPATPIGKLGITKKHLENVFYVLEVHRARAELDNRGSVTITRP